MTSQQQQLIKYFIVSLSVDKGTDAIISFVASRNGLLAACKKLQKTVEQEGVENLGWLREECKQSSITLNTFLQHLSHIVTLFTPTENVAEYYKILRLPVGAGFDEIKKSYRKLSLRYHPDTASAVDGEAAKTFLQITKAYHILMERDGKIRASSGKSTQKQWQPSRKKHVKPERRRKLFLWGAVLVALASIFSAVASNQYRKQAMLRGLKESHVVFDEPKTATGISAQDGEDKYKDALVVVTPDSSEHIQRLSTKKNDPAEMNVQAELLDNIQGGKDHVDVDSSAATFKQTEIAPVSSADNHDRPGGVVDGPQLKGGMIAGTEPLTLQVKKTQLKRDNVSDIKKTLLVNNTKKDPKASKQDIHMQSMVIDSGVAGQNTEISQPLVDTKADTKEGRSEKVHIPEEDSEKLLPGVDDRPKNQMHETTLPQIKLDERLLAETDVQSAIDTFLSDYVSAYEQRNVVLFSTFFEPAALENGKPFTTMIPVYSDLFAKTSKIEMDITTLAWEAKDHGVFIRTRFKVYLGYRDSHEIHATGSMRFVLKNNSGTFLIHSMEYELDR